MRTAPANIWDSAGSHCHVCDIRRVMFNLFKRTKKTVKSLSKPSIGEERRVLTLTAIHRRRSPLDSLPALVFQYRMERDHSEFPDYLLGCLIERVPHVEGVGKPGAALSQ